jgi:hypothetical protein
VIVRLFAICAFLLTALPAIADKQEGYYYPPVTSEEEFTRAIITAPPSNRNVRIGFVTTVTKAQLEAPETPRFVMFAKGENSRRLIMVALDDEVFKTLFRARAVMAQFTSNLRNTEFFLQQGLSTAGTFYDMLQILDFESLTISDGETWSHRVYFK